MKPQLLLKSLHSNGGDGHGNLLFQYNVVSAIKRRGESAQRECRRGPGLSLLEEGKKISKDFLEVHF